jgi:hypothetical protein
MNNETPNQEPRTKYCSLPIEMLDTLLEAVEEARDSAREAYADGKDAIIGTDWPDEYNTAAGERLRRYTLAYEMLDELKGENDV